MLASAFAIEFTITLSACVKPIATLAVSIAQNSTKRALALILSSAASVRQLSFLSVMSSPLLLGNCRPDGAEIKSRRNTGYILDYQRITRPSRTKGSVL